MKNEPLKELLKIASHDMLLAKKIAVRFPVELINYETIIREQSFHDTNMSDLSMMLIDKLDPKVFSLRKLLKIRKNLEYTKNIFAVKVIEKIPDSMLDIETIFSSLKSNNEDERDLAAKLSERIPKSSLSFKKLIKMVHFGHSVTASVVKKLLMKYYQSDVDFGTLMRYSIDSDVYIRTESIRALLTNHKEKLTYIDFIKFLSVTDEKIKTWVRNLTFCAPSATLDYVKLLELYDAASDKTESEIRETIALLFPKIYPAKFNITTLFTLMGNMGNITAGFTRKIILELGRTPSFPWSFDKILPFVNSDSSNVRSASRETLVCIFPKDDKLSFELLKSFYNESGQEMKQKIAEIMIARFPEKISLTMLITFLGLQMKSVSECAKMLISKIDYNLIDLFDLVDLTAFYKSSYDLAPIQAFATEYLQSLPKEVLLKDEERLSWYSKNGNNKEVREMIDRLLKSCRTDYDAKVEEFFTRHKIEF